jgi:hypothetical protein
VIFSSARRAIMPSRALHGTFNGPLPPAIRGRTWAAPCAPARSTAALKLDLDTFPPRSASSEIAS